MATISPNWKLFIYSGTPTFNGVTFSSANALKDKIEELFPKTIKGSFVTATQLAQVIDHSISEEMDLLKRVILVFPGGECGVWDIQLQGTLKKIRSFVERGGNLLMVCAGAYFSAKQSLYRSPQGIIERSRGLDFFPGKATGPKQVTPDDIDPHNVGVMSEVVHETTKKTGYAYKMGGGEFIPDPSAKEGEDYEIIIRYGDGTIAAARSIIGSGKVVMTFLHIEYDPFPKKTLESRSEKNRKLLEDINVKLNESQEFRDQFFMECFEYFIR